MRKDEDGTIVLSRRNLLALLSKLDGNPPESFCMIRGGDDAPGVIIKAEEDDEHYADRAAGRMHPDTENLITKPSTGTQWAIPRGTLRIILLEEPHDADA